MTARKLMILSLAAALAACGDGGDNRQANGAEAAPEARTGDRTQTIAASAQAAPDLSSFMQMVESAGLTETLQGAGPYTVFAPVNDAFAALPEEARAALATPEQRPQLVALLSQHIVPGAVTSEDLARAVERGEEGRAELATVAGTNLTIARDGTGIVIIDGSDQPARIVGGGQVQTNGLIHRIDRVLAPPAPPAEAAD